MYWCIFSVLPGVTQKNCAFRYVHVLVQPATLACVVYTDVSSRDRSVYGALIKWNRVQKRSKYRHALTSKSNIQQISTAEPWHIIKLEPAVGCTFRVQMCSFCIWSVPLSRLWRLITRANRFRCACQPCLMVHRQRDTADQTWLLLGEETPPAEGEPPGLITPRSAPHLLSDRNHCLSWLLWCRHVFWTEAGVCISAHAYKSIPMPETRPFAGDLLMP